MAKVARIGDTISHDDVVTGQIIEGSSDTLVDEIGVARVGDKATCSRKGHGEPSIVSGSGSTLTNGRPTARIGDSLSCGAVISSGSSTRDVD